MTQTSQLREYHRREQGVMTISAFVAGTSIESSVDFSLIAEEDGSLNGMTYSAGDNVIASSSMSVRLGEEMELYALDSSLFELEEDTGNLLYNY